MARHEYNCDCIDCATTRAEEHRRFTARCSCGWEGIEAVGKSDAQLALYRHLKRCQGKRDGSIVPMRG